MKNLSLRKKMSGFLIHLDVQITSPVTCTCSFSIDVKITVITMVMLKSLSLVTCISILLSYLDSQSMSKSLPLSSSSGNADRYSPVELSFITLFTKSADGNKLWLKHKKSTK